MNRAAPQQPIRELFPFGEDCAVARAFLKGECLTPQPNWLTSSTPKGLRVNDELVAWFDTQGSLIGQLPTGASTPTVIRLLHFLLDELGIAARIERNVSVPGVTGWILRYFYDGSEIAHPTDPITLCGPLVVQAYRAERSGT